MNDKSTRSFARPAKERIYIKAKAETFCGFRPGNLRASAGGGGVGTGCRTPCCCSAAVGSASFSESRPGKIGHISFGVKQTRKPSAGNLHAGFDAAGTGNQFTVWLLRHSQRKRRETARPNLPSMAPVLDPTTCPWRSSPGSRLFQKAHCGAPCKGLIPGVESGAVSCART